MGFSHRPLKLRQEGLSGKGIFASVVLLGLFHIGLFYFFGLDQPETSGSQNVWPAAGSGPTTDVDVDGMSQF